MSVQTIVCIQHLNHFFGKGNLQSQVLYDINFKVKSKDFVIVTGPSGSGKSTLLSLIGCLRSVQEGSLKILGQELQGATREQLVQMRRHFGYITQSSNLLHFLTVRQNVQIALELLPDISRKEANSRIEEILEAVGLTDKLDVYPSNLSGGQKQRVAIACALVTRPQLVLADEPTAALDKVSGRNVVALMHRLAKDQGSAIIMVTHDNRILDLATCIMHVEDGRLALALNQELSIALPGIDEALLAKSERQPTLLTYQAKEIIVRQGDPANQFYIILEGEVEVYQEAVSKPPRHLSRLRRGDYFGEVGLLCGGQRTATVQVAAESEVKVMVIEEDLFNLLITHSELTNAEISRQLRQRVMNSHLASVLPNVDPADIIAVVAQAKSFRYGANSTIVQQGEPADKFYLVFTGEVEVSGLLPGNGFTSRRLKVGEYFGHPELATGECYPFTVQTQPDAEAELLTIERESFCSLILKSKTNQDIVASVISHRLMSNSVGPE
ncbi:cyclic nucleotide-binding domain-containing protein [Trichocoleus sp. FACHB-262]|uniref:cyclic nucleotide-binding domain-containing protein n=1 Tax=Trichocoleus sp. FACHB-262 TaxID=2692869 RepID=UPI0016892FF2|nr:cyclic nucleotide-binding domain-containing protein [Trichocoleus sp. FACHB-262]MBD2124659.1 cyclic nucleotide-binding domain-containing protein [Trichocoleus sp. FACHB-262]